jgi:hypothetical protein
LFKLGEYVVFPTTVLLKFLCCSFNSGIRKKSRIFKDSFKYNIIGFLNAEFWAALFRVRLIKGMLGYLGIPSFFTMSMRYNTQILKNKIISREKYSEERPCLKVCTAKTWQFKIVRLLNGFCECNLAALSLNLFTFCNTTEVTISIF